MLSLCQKDSFVKTNTSKVVSCEKAPVEPSKDKKKGAAPEAAVYHVILEETSLFPEGGGQPGDKGQMTAGGATVNVTNTFRDKNAAIVHATDAPVEVGSTATVAVDWARRFDHMQQHSAQHLVSAIAEKEPFLWQTASWGLGEESCYVEFETPELDEAMVADLEKRVNDAILEALPVTWSLAESGEKTEVNNNGGAVPVRVVSIAGMDRNPCCGTHVGSTAQLQAFAIVGTETRHKGMKCIIFLAGKRVARFAKEAAERERRTGALLSCAARSIEEKVEFLQGEHKAAQRAATAMAKDLTRELARGFVEDAKQARASAAGETLKMWTDRDAFGQTGPFLSEIVTELEQILSKDEKWIFVATGTSSPGAKDGSVVVAGSDTASVSSAGKTLVEALEGKGGGKPGRFMGKVANMGKKGLAAAKETIFAQIK